MLRDYAPILVLLALVAGFAVVNVVLSEWLGRNRRSIGKGNAYECGMSAEGSARLRLSIHFYLVAVDFILFDVEALMLLPWTVTARTFSELDLGTLVFAQVGAFIGLLGFGLAYVWAKGGLSWDR